ncbi:MAG: hypothetical protein HYS18_15405 [Burkholderiales bacterium]|nr:hypothetical protein [Burkholderiales bacterium]
MKKYIGLFLSVLVIVAVAAGLYKSAQQKKAQDTAQTSGALKTGTEPRTVKLLVGSAKFGFLKDPALTGILEKEGLRLDLIKSGAFEQDKNKVGEIDAVWPAGANTAADWAGLIKGSATYPVFSTPLALASWKALIPVFEKNGLGKMIGAAHGDFYLEKALPLMLKSTRWNQLKENEVFNVNKGFLVNTPDLRKSATGSLYIAALTYIKNGNEVVQSLDKANGMAEELSPLITRQGFQEGTLAGPFEDYIGQGMGKAPLVLIYESQFIEAKRANKLHDAHVLLYPQPGLVLKHIFVGKTPAGKKLGELLSTDAGIQKIAAQYGFRTNDPAVFATETKQIGLDAPELLNLAETPSTTILDAINQTIVKKLEGK